MCEVPPGAFETGARTMWVSATRCAKIETVKGVAMDVIDVTDGPDEGGARVVRRCSQG
jgi:hypothetical protein